MHIAGLQKLTLLDFPGHVACTVFLGGCNLRRPFCHNASLLEQAPRIEPRELMDFLQKRRGLLEGVAVTGGEPLLQPELAGLLRDIRSLGYRIKLDTNGCFPERLQALLEEGLVDYVAMDIKNSPEKYELTCGRSGVLEAVRRSVALLMQGPWDYEFRTTVVQQFHEARDFEAIGRWIAGARRYYLQHFVDSGQLLTPGLSGVGPGQMELFRAISAKYVENTQLRGE